MPKNHLQYMRRNGQVFGLVEDASGNLYARIEEGHGVGTLLLRDMSTVNGAVLPLTLVLRSRVSEPQVQLWHLKLVNGWGARAI